MNMNMSLYNNNSHKITNGYINNIENGNKKNININKQSSLNKIGGNNKSRNLNNQGYFYRKGGTLEGICYKKFKYGVSNFIQIQSQGVNKVKDKQYRNYLK